MISPCIRIIFTDNYDIVVCDIFLNFKPRCAYFWMLSLLGPALKLWLKDKKIYTVERLIQTCHDVCIIWVFVLSGCPYLVSSLEKSHRHVIYLIYSIKEQGGRRVGTMTVAKSQGCETCRVGGRKFIIGLQTGRKKDVSKSNVSCYLAVDVLVIKSY